MNGFKIALVAGGLVAANLLTGCEQFQKAGAAVQVYQTVRDPAVPLQDKACTVLAWGLPIAQDRAAKATLTITQQSLANAAAQAASAYCTGKDLTWQQ